MQSYFVSLHRLAFLTVFQSLLASLTTTAKYNFFLVFLTSTSNLTELTTTNAFYSMSRQMSIKKSRFSITKVITEISVNKRQRLFDQ